MSANQKIADEIFIPFRQALVKVLACYSEDEASRFERLMVEEDDLQCTNERKLDSAAHCLNYTLKHCK